MDIRRIVKHLSIGEAAVRRVFPVPALQRIEQAITEVERHTSGQVRFAVEHALDLPALLHGQMARQRAIQMFSELQVWDTEHNNGVLIYLLLADRDVEIVADRGIHARVGTAAWEQLCQEMEAHFRAGCFEQGVLHGIRQVGLHLSTHFPPLAGQRNELPDAPVVR
ncbi:MAG: TPM domain-containing protein [Sideroxydans sp.]